MRVWCCMVLVLCQPACKKGASERPAPSRKEKETDLGGSTSPSATSRPVRRQLKPYEPAAATINGFSFDLYRKLRKAKNLCVSPVGVVSTLALAQLGARGKTASELAKVLRFSQPPSRMHRELGALFRRVGGLAKPLVDCMSGKYRNYYCEKTTTPHELTIESSMWVKKEYRLEPAFLQRARQSYGAMVSSIDLTRPRAASERINSWIARATHDRIKDAIAAAALRPLDRLILTNAVYLKALWREPFREMDTKPAPFYLDRERKTTATMMHLYAAHFLYYDDSQLQLVDLPFRTKSKKSWLSMIILLPRKRDGLALLEKQLALKRLDLWLSKGWMQDVNLALPKFEAAGDVPLEAALKALGVRTLFSERQSDLSGISSEKPLFASSIAQRTWIAVDEKGVEAAAATRMMLTGGVPQPIWFAADHPFLYIIRDRISRTILFIGRVTHPRLFSSHG